jgi:hypothetical protein
MQTPGKKYAGTVIRETVTFTNAAGTAVDPDTVTFKTCSPSGQKASYVYLTDSNVGKSATGSYYADFTPDKTGRWFYQWSTTGDGTTVVEEGDVLIQSSPFLDYVEEAYIIP